MLCVHRDILPWTLLKFIVYLLHFSQICTFLTGTTIQWIDDQRVPYAVKGNEWVGFDNQESITTKVLLVIWL